MGQGNRGTEGKGTGLGIPAWAREGLGPGESGGNRPQPPV